MNQRVLGISAAVAGEDVLVEETPPSKVVILERDLSSSANYCFFHSCFHGFFFDHCAHSKFWVLLLFASRDFDRYNRKVLDCQSKFASRILF